MAATRNTSKMTCALAVLAVLLRVLLPALHTHHAHAPAGGAASAGHGGTAAVAVCSCGAVHKVREASGGPGTPTTAQAQEDLTGVGAHTCLACELEDGTPCAGPASAFQSMPERGATALPPSNCSSRPDSQPAAAAALARAAGPASLIHLLRVLFAASTSLRSSVSARASAHPVLDHDFC